MANDPRPVQVAPTIRAVLFDLDDTLVPTQHLDSIRRTGDRNGLRKALPGLQPFPGIQEVVKGVGQHCPIGIVSKARRWYVEEVLRHCFPQIRWAVMVTYESTTRRKPYPDPLQLALRELHISESHSVVYVGDDRDDVEASLHAGLMMVQWTGELDPRGLIPDALVRDATELRRFFDEPNEFRPVVEACYWDPEVRKPQVIRIPQKGRQSILALGRFFAREGASLLVHERHPVSQALAAFKEIEPGSSDAVPAFLTKALLISLEPVTWA